MVVCPYCRWSNPEQTAVCLHCGAVLPSASPPPYARAASARRLPGGTAALRPALLLIRRVRGRRLPRHRQLAVGQLVWSIINIVMGFIPLGIAALVMTILAQSATGRRRKNGGCARLWS